MTKVKGHATEADVDPRPGQAGGQLGNIEADTAADLGKRHQTEAVMDVRRALLRLGNSGIPIVLQLHRFMVAVYRVSVNHDGRGVFGPRSSCLGSGELH